MLFQRQLLSLQRQKQVEKAEEQLEYLKATMSPEELNAYILKGEDPLLSNKWAVSVVDGQSVVFKLEKLLIKLDVNNQV